MPPRTMSPLAIAMWAALAGCASDVVSSDADADTSDGGSDPGYCVGAEGPWASVQSEFPQMTSIWSDGERFVAHGDDTLLTFDGQTSTFHPGVTAPTSLREIEAIDIDDAWLVGPQTIYHWDGTSAATKVSQIHDPYLEIAADGQPWLVAHKPCTRDECQPRLWSYEGGDVWDELPVPTLDRAYSFWAGPDGELWLGHHGQVSHRLADGTWETAYLSELGYEGAQPHFGFRASSIDVDALGNMWMLSDLYGIYLARRNPQGEWAFSSYEASAEGTSRSTVLADGDQALIHHETPTRPLYRWALGQDGVDEVATRTQLEIAEFTDVGGPVDRLHVLSPGPRIQKIDTHASPVVAQEIVHYPNLAPSIGSAVTIDATFAGRDDVLHQFDGERWNEILRVPSVISYADETQGFADIQAVSDASGWLIVAKYDEQQYRMIGEALWRWQGDTLLEANWTEPSWVELTHVWPRDLDSAWVLAARQDELEVWYVDPDEQRLEFTWPTRALAVTGDEQYVHVVTADGTLLRAGEAGWIELGDASFVAHPQVLPEAELALVGTELVLRFEGPTLSDGFTAFNLRWDGSEWLPMPDTPLFERIRGDRFGRAWAIAGETLYRHDGQQPADEGWVAVDLDGVTAEARINPADDGVVIHAESSTSSFRWSCD